MFPMHSVPFCVIEEHLVAVHYLGGHDECIILASIWVFAASLALL